MVSDDVSGYVSEYVLTVGASDVTAFVDQVRVIELLGISWLHGDNLGSASLATNEAGRNVSIGTKPRGLGI